MHETDWAASRPHVSSECNCHDLHIFLYELVDNELTDEDCSRLKRHISECPACAEKVAAYVRVSPYHGYLYQRYCST